MVLFAAREINALVEGYAMAKRTSGRLNGAGLPLIAAAARLLSRELTVENERQVNRPPVLCRHSFFFESR